MKRGFALLETMIVITFVLVSLLVLYKTVDNMYKNTRDNIIYDDAAKLYKTYYTLEYLRINNLKDYIRDDMVVELTCNNLNISNCKVLFQELDIKKIYIINNNLELKNIDDNLREYLKSLNKKDDAKYRFVVEFNDKNYYASLNLEGDQYE